MTSNTSIQRVITEAGCVQKKWGNKDFNEPNSTQTKQKKKRLTYIKPKKVSHVPILHGSGKGETLFVL
jgi:hypothetical protein